MTIIKAAMALIAMQKGETFQAEGKLSEAISFTRQGVEMSETATRGECVRDRIFKLQ